MSFAPDIAIPSSPGSAPGPAFVVLPAGAARREACARGGSPWRAALSPPTPDPDEDASLPGLLTAARAFFDQLIGLFGAPADIAAQPDLDPTKRELLRRWAPNLAFIVRQLLVTAALALMAEIADAPSSARRKPATEQASTPRPPPGPTRSRRRTLAVGAVARLPNQTSPGAAPPSSARLPEAALLADLVDRIGATLEDFDACARRLARRMARATRNAVAALRIILPDPPPSILRDGRYNPLSRKAQMAWGLACDALDRVRPKDADDG